MSDILSTEIYPKLYERLPQALPEFGFVIGARGYQSTTDVKMTGESGKRGKVYVYANNPSYLHDYTRGHQSIWDYIQQRDGLDNSSTFKALARLADHELSLDHLTPEAIARIEQGRAEAQLWEDINTFCIHSLSHQENAFAHSSGAGSVRTYLQSTRGYSPDLFTWPIKAEGGLKTDHDKTSLKMELGYLPSLFDLHAHLIDEVGYQLGQVQHLLTDERIGRSHQLTIPYRDQTGRIRGMLFRSVNSEEPKYLYSAGLEKNKILFNLRAVARDRDLVLVEAQLDAMHATSLGITNVCAIGGSKISLEQVNLMIQQGVRRITLMFDNDKAGRVATEKAIALLHPFRDRVRIYVALLPDGVKDLDELLLHEDPAATFEKVKSRAIDDWRWMLEQLFTRYAGDDVTDKQINSLLDEVVDLGKRLPKLDSDQLFKTFTDAEDVQRLGITPASLADVSDRIRQAEQKQQQTKELRELVDDANRKLSTVDPVELATGLVEKGREIQQANPAETFGELTRPENERAMALRLRDRPNNVETGYTIEGEKLVIPSGAITVVAAPTSHGKTSFMLNLALRIINYQPQKSVYVLSYEEDKDSVLISAMSMFIGTEISSNNRRSIRSFYKDNSTEFIRPAEREGFLKSRKRFFTDLIDTGLLNVHYVSYDSDKLVEAIRYLHLNGNAGAILIDYVQLLHKGQQGKNKYPSRQEELKQICLDLKDIAVETGLPIIVGAQFNRQVVNPARMHNTHIREAADIEQIANLVLGFWNNNLKMLAGEDEVTALGCYDSGPDQIYIEKMKDRWGLPGLAAMLQFDGNIGLITNKGLR